MKPFAVLLASCKKNAPDRFNGPALAADDPPHIALGHPDLDTNILAVGVLSNFNGIGLANERFYDLFNGLFHEFVEFVELIELIENKRLNEPFQLNKLFHNCCFSRIILDQALYRFGGLSTNTDPILDAIVFEFHLGRVDHRVIGTYVFKILAVAL